MARVKENKKEKNPNKQNPRQIAKTKTKSNNTEEKGEKKKENKQKPNPRRIIKTKPNKEKQTKKWTKTNQKKQENKELKNEDNQ